MKIVTTTQKLNENKPITESNFKMRIKDLLHPFFNRLLTFYIRRKIIVERDETVSSKQPIIYVVNHTCSLDIPIMARLTNMRPYFLLGTQQLGKLEKFYFQMTGSIFVDRKDKEDRANSKKAMIEYIKKGRSIVIFPEGTWNLTDNQMLLPTKWGIMDVAKSTGARVIPVILDYDLYEDAVIAKLGHSCQLCIDQDNMDLMYCMRDTMATMRWDLWERKGIYKREDIDVQQERKKLEQNILDYPPLDWEYEQSCIYKQNIDSDDYMEHLNINKKNAFLLKNQR